MQPDGGERRRKARYELELAMQVWPTGHGCVPCRATTVNVNAAGMLFMLHSGSPRDFRPGASFRFNFELVASPDESRPHVVGTGYVLRVEEGHDRRIAAAITSWCLVRQAVEVPQMHMTTSAC